VLLTIAPNPGGVVFGGHMLLVFSLFPRDPFAPNPGGVSARWLLPPEKRHPIYSTTSWRTCCSPRGLRRRGRFLTS